MKTRIKIMVELSPEIANKLMVKGAKIGLVKKKYCEKVLIENANKD